jgi:hypothetical protein
MYNAMLVNRGAIPVRVEVCAFQDDVGTKGEAIAFQVQRYDIRDAEWISVADASGPKACRPYPLGWVTAQLRTRWLWPAHPLHGRGSDGSAGLSQG